MLFGGNLKRKMWVAKHRALKLKSQGSQPAFPKMGAAEPASSQPSINKLPYLV